MPLRGPKGGPPSTRGNFGRSYIDTGALSKTRLAEEGSIEEPKKDAHSSRGERQKTKTEYML